MFDTGTQARLCNDYNTPSPSPLCGSGSLGPAAAGCAVSKYCMRGPKPIDCANMGSFMPQSDQRKAQTERLSMHRFSGLCCCSCGSTDTRSALACCSPCLSPHGPAQCQCSQAVQLQTSISRAVQVVHIMQLAADAGPLPQPARQPYHLTILRFISHLARLPASALLQAWTARAIDLLSAAIRNSAGTLQAVHVTAATAATFSSLLLRGRCQPAQPRPGMGVLLACMRDPWVRRIMGACVSGARMQKQAVGMLLIYWNSPCKRHLHCVWWHVAHGKHLVYFFLSVQVGTLLLLACSRCVHETLHALMHPPAPHNQSAKESEGKPGNGAWQHLHMMATQQYELQRLLQVSVPMLACCLHSSTMPAQQSCRHWVQPLAWMGKGMLRTMHP